MLKSEGLWERMFYICGVSLWKLLVTIGFLKNKQFKVYKALIVIKNI